MKKTKYTKNGLIDGRTTKTKRFDEKITISLNNELLEYVLHLSENENISVSRMMRILIRMAQKEKLLPLKEWIHNSSDSRDIDEVLNDIKNNK